MLPALPHSVLHNLLTYKAIIIGLDIVFNSMHYPLAYQSLDLEKQSLAQ